MNELVNELVNNYNISLPACGDCAIRIPKRIATIKLCGGAMTFYIDDTMQWQRPTDEQIKNLKELFCIEVIPEEPYGV